VLPARHYSGRLTSRNKTLWAGFALETGKRRLFFSGDSGYGPHFAEIGQKFSGFDLVFLDCGQYDKRWANIHMNPEEAVEAAKTCKLKHCYLGMSASSPLPGTPGMSRSYALLRQAGRKISGS